MERRKYIGRANGAYVAAHTSKIVRVDQPGLSGYAALVSIQKVSRPFIVGEGLYLYDDGYSEINYLPDGENWALSAIYDAGGGIVEWYFDITRANAVDECGRPYLDDLYLDAVLTPDGEVIVLDEDELAGALNEGRITRQDFDSAYRALDGLRRAGILERGHMEALSARLKDLF